MTPARAIVLLALAFAVLAAVTPVGAQENFEIQVYGSETMTPGRTMVELHSNVAAQGTTHGSANADDQRVPVLFLGHGIKPGKYSQAATPADLAPTLHDRKGQHAIRPDCREQQR